MSIDWEKVCCNGIELYQAGSAISVVAKIEQKAKGQERRTNRGTDLMLSLILINPEFTIDQIYRFPHN